MVITLLNGTVADTNDISFNSSTYHFYWDSGSGGQVDVTNVMTRDQKFFWPDFDPVKDNYRLSNERIAAKGGSITVQTMTGPKTIPASDLPLGPVGQTSVAANFFEGVQSDLGKIGGGLGIGAIFAVGVVALIFFGSRR